MWCARQFVWVLSPPGGRPVYHLKLRSGRPLIFAQFQLSTLFFFETYLQPGILRIPSYQVYYSCRTLGVRPTFGHVVASRFHYDHSVAVDHLQLLIAQDRFNFYQFLADFTLLELPTPSGDLRDDEVKYAAASRMLRSLPP